MKTPNNVFRDRMIMNEAEIREALNRHWAASDENDFDVEHAVYGDDAVLEYPQSGERIRGRHNIQASRVAQPNAKRFTVRRIVGSGDLWSRNSFSHTTAGRRIR
jgi:ketosteroid isomerase-like protein